MTAAAISRETLLQTFRVLPEKITMEEVFDKIIYLFKIEEGLAQSEKGEGKTMDEIRKSAKAWEKKL